MDRSCSTGSGTTCNLVGAVREPPLQNHDYGHRNRRHGFVVMSNLVHAITIICRPPVGAQSRRCKEGGLCATASHGTQIEIDPIR